MVAPRDYKKQLTDGSGAFAANDEITINFYSSELPGKGSTERGFYWWTGGTDGDQAELKVKIIDRYGNASEITKVYNPPSTITPVTSLTADQTFEQITAGQPIRVKFTWANPPVTDNNGNPTYPMRLEYYYKAYTGSDLAQPNCANSCGQ